MADFTVFCQPLWPLGALYCKSKGGFVKFKLNFPAFKIDLSASINLTAYVKLL
jgi:hypothetical protein